MQAGITTHAFPGAAVAVTHQGKLVALKGLGAFTYDPDAPRVQPDTIYDLASVTKVVATTAMAMVLYERGVLDLDAPVASIVPEFAESSAGVDLSAGVDSSAGVLPAVARASRPRSITTSRSEERRVGKECRL